jgi:hypothetical protein
MLPADRDILADTRTRNRVEWDAASRHETTSHFFAHEFIRAST